MLRKYNYFLTALLLSVAVLLPAYAQQVIGAWFDHACSCVKTIEASGGKYYLTENGVRYKQLKKASNNKYLSMQTTAGDNYVIRKDGRLELRDNLGLIDILPKAK